jgi:hypothetical protein
MSAKNFALGLLVAGVMTAAVVAVVYFASTSPSSNNSTSSASPSLSLTSNSTTSTNSTAWTVIQTNTTLYYGPACTPLGVFELSCPTINEALHSPSLSNVDVVGYRGEEMYDVNFSYDFNGQPLTYTIWFTNDTVFCVSPSYDGNVLCPVHPIFPNIGITTPSASAINPSNGLRLDLQLSNTTEGINVTIGVYNTLNRINNVTSASDWAIYSNSLIDICDNQVVAFAVYQGTYGAGNFTTGSPLAIDNVRGGSICPVLSPSVFYAFDPDSGVASAPAGAFGPAPGSKNVTLSYTTSGYSTCGVGALLFRPSNASGLWLCPQDTGYKFNPFPPGTYTIVALDQWADAAIAQFEVYG